jgi:outer membrane protein
VKISVLTLSLVLGCALGAAQNPTKVGIIHIQNAILGTKDGQKALQELEAHSAPKKKDLETRQQAILAKQDQLNKMGNVGNEEQKTKLIRDIDQMKKAFTRDVDDAQADLDQENQKLMNELGSKVMQVLDKYAKDNGYALIIDVSNQQTSPVLYAANGIDVTLDIISAYDKTSGMSTPTTTSAPRTVPPAAAKPAATSPAKPVATPPKPTGIK